VFRFVNEISIGDLIVTYSPFGNADTWINHATRPALASGISSPNFECEISAILNRLKAFNANKSPRLVQLTAAQVAVNALLRFMIEQSLSPNAITDGEPKSLEG